MTIMSYVHICCGDKCALLDRIMNWGSWINIILPANSWTQRESDGAAALGDIGNKIGIQLKIAEQ